MSVRGNLFSEFRKSFPKFFFSVPFSYLLLDHIEPYVFMDNWSSLPFNGQARRMRTIASIAANADFDVVIETGTYLGSSTPYLAGLFNCDTYTIEINQHFAKRAQNRFSNNHPSLKITAFVGDSAEVVGKILENVSKEKVVFAYLDAHWLDAIPTGQEIKHLIEWGGEWIAVVDDFLVPNDSGYKYDSYGEKIIGSEIIPENPNIEVWIPRESAEFETGVRSGTGYIFSNTSMVKRLPENLFKNLTRIK
jgi:predicted O-methyltransferase YrrM